MKNKDISGKTLEDVGISVLLIALFAATIVCSLSDRSVFNENLVGFLTPFLD